MTITKFYPKTITSQLIVLMSAVLLIAQVINLLILVGENRIRAKANLVNSSMEHASQTIASLPDLNRMKLPHELRGREFKDGRAYLANRSRALLLDSTIRLESHENQARDVLNKYKVEYKSVQLALVPANSRHSFKLQEEETRQFRQPKRHRFREPRGKRPPPKPKGRRPALNPMVAHLVVSIELDDNTWFNLILPHPPIEPLTPKIVVATTVLFFITLVSVAFFMRRITRPLSSFTQAADEFGRGKVPELLKEDGPNDIRQAAQAFNRMQRRLARTIETQRTMLRAVGHDLRTPLTSLRIRSELIPDSEQRNKFINTINDMTLMTEEILDWTKNASALEAMAQVDIKALLTSIVDDFSDQGHNVILDSTTLVNVENTVLNIRRLGLKRALMNVIGNAVKYAGSAKVSFELSAEHFAIYVEDNGPGIPDHKIGEAIKPFVRLESSRNKKTGGTGLGLSIAETILQADGGRLMLKNKQPKGLRVTLSLPR